MELWKTSLNIEVFRGFIKFIKWIKTSFTDFSDNVGKEHTKSSLDHFQILLGVLRCYSGVGGEGNGTPLQYSCLENPMDGGAWQAAVHGVAQSRT